MASLGDLTLKLTLDASGAISIQGQVIGQFKNIETQAKTTGAAASTGFMKMKEGAGQFLMGLGLTGMGFMMLGMETKKAADFVIHSFLEEQDAATRLLFALNGDVEVFGRLNEAAEEMSHKSIFSHDDIQTAMAFEAAQGRTEEQIKKTVQAAMNLQAVLGGDLQGNLMKLDMTYEGSIGRLGRLSKGIKDLSQEELANGKAVDLINEKYRGFAEKMSTTYSGKLAQFWNGVKKQAAEFGGAIVKLIDDIVHAVPYITTAISKGIGEFVSFLGQTAIAMNDWINKIPLVGGLTEGFRTKIAGDMKSTGDELIRLADLNKKKLEIEDFVGRVKTKVGEISGKYQPTGGDPGPGKGKETKDKEEELNLIKLQEEELKKLQAQLQANLGDAGAEFEIRQKILEVEQKIYDLKYGPAIKGLGEAKTFEDIYEIPERLKPTKGEIPDVTEGGGVSELSTTGISAATEIFNILNRKPQNLFDTFVSMVQIAQQIMLMMNFTKAESFLGPVGGLIGALGGLFMHRASGGDMEAGRGYLINEGLPELFFPGVSGYMMSNAAMRAAGSGGSPVTVELHGAFTKEMVTDIVVRGGPPANVVIKKGTVS